MKAIASIVRELSGLFVEDWTFAFELATVLATLVLMSAFSIGSANTRALLLTALPAMALLMSVARARVP
jgi:hypothetical protein